MSQGPARLWDEMLAEFRALGGTADNLRLDDGPLGRGLFVIDPTRPFLLRTPPGLLVNVADIVFRDGVLTVAQNAQLGEGERKFFEAYHAHFSWGGGGRAEIERIFEQAAELPSELRHKLASQYHCGPWFDDPSQELIQKLFIETREFGGLAGREVMMPMIELANHGPGCSYLAEDGISLKGTVRDEVTVLYTDIYCDAYDIFRSWGFASEGNVAFSAELVGFPVGATRFYIERNTRGANVGSRPVLPTLQRKGDDVKLNFLMLGNSRMPRLCRGNFRNLFRSFGLEDVDEAFDRIRAVNHQHFLALLTDLEPLNGEMVNALRRMARMQLQALTRCYGSREL